MFTGLNKTSFFLPKKKKKKKEEFDVFKLRTVAPDVFLQKIYSLILDKWGNEF